eukprot:5366062-Pleurochrysis_carterae.AAC.1
MAVPMAKYRSKANFAKAGEGSERSLVPLEEIVFRGRLRVWSTDEAQRLEHRLVESFVCTAYYLIRC